METGRDSKRRSVDIEDAGALDSALYQDPIRTAVVICDRTMRAGRLAVEVREFRNKSSTSACPLDFRELEPHCERPR